MLTHKMKIEIINYTMRYSKGLIEDVDLLSKAYDDGEVSIEEMDEFIEELKEYLLNSIG